MIRNKMNTKVTDHFLDILNFLWKNTTEGSRNNATIMAEIKGIDTGKIKKAKRMTTKMIEIHIRTFLFIYFDNEKYHSILRGIVLFLSDKKQ
jgi:hypothetical protein